MILFAALGAWALDFPSIPEPHQVWGCQARVTEIGFTGDVMIHGMQLRAARQPDGSYDMSGVFTAVAPLMSAPALTAANLETTLSGEELGFTGYPAFNSPRTILHSLRDAGVDLLQTSNNHCLDRGYSGLVRTLDAVDEEGFLHVGTYREPQDRERGWQLVQLPGGPMVAFLAYTYGTERDLPLGLRGRVNTLDPDLILRDVANARADGAELVVVALHWGLEYRDEPEPAQRELARELVEAGVDVIWGTHPHVLQPAEVHTIDDPVRGGTRDALVLYSLGNYVSNQRKPRRWGGVFVRIAVGHCDRDGRTWLQGVRFSPVWVDDRAEGRTLDYRVIPADDRACWQDHVTAQDCRRLWGFRDHAATILPPEHFDWEPTPPEGAWRWWSTVRPPPLAWSSAR